MHWPPLERRWPQRKGRKGHIDEKRRPNAPRASPHDRRVDLQFLLSSQVFFNAQGRVSSLGQVVMPHSFASIVNAWQAGLLCAFLRPIRVIV